VIRWNSLGLLASNGLIQFSMIFVFAVEPPAIAGLYAAAISLATPASMLSQAISQVLLARFSSWAAIDAAAARRNFVRVLLGMTLLLTAVFAIVALLSGLIIHIVFGAGYAPAEVTMQVLLAAVLAFSITLVANAYLMTTGRTAHATIASIAGLVAGLAVMVLGETSGWSGTAAASSGVLIGYIIALVITAGFAIAPERAVPRWAWLAAPAE
jgi:O-antigen/teichoic acid export membrane protein